MEGILREMPAEQDREPDRERIRENASIAREQILRCRNVTQHFLRLSRGQRPQGDIVDLSSAIAAAARLIEPTARAHSVKLELGPLAAGIHVRADEAELEHTLINLLLNAVQACRPGGTVASGLEAGSDIRIRVTDNGCGIAPENRQRIFEPFFSARQGGTGLGLFLSLNFVRRWGGDILVESVAGKGSTFEVVLPALTPEPEPVS